ncbi:heat shock protein Hsp90 [Amylostereum chailletii]|nr:heat shock protein Hsp90 [Amylostereum chailletii]
MRLFASLLFGLALASSAETHGYQSDVGRMRKIVINRDVFLRELISNANDALEKLRLLSLTDKDYWDGSSSLNVTIKAVKDVDDSGGRLIITDNGVGMTPEELTGNLGTLAKSGTTEFLSKAENNQDTAGTGNLIGAFGVGFYSSFLVADQVYVASVPAKTHSNPDTPQYVFSSTAEENDFAIYPDPRGRTLERGTEITLILKPDAVEYLDNVNISKLVGKHSIFSTSFPVYLYELAEQQIPEDENGVKDAAEATETDDDEAIVEELGEDQEIKSGPKMKTVIVENWVHLNAQPPLWTRDSKNISSFEYELFYQATFKDFAAKPLAWHHFAGDVGSGISFKSIIFIPGKLDDSYWQAPLQSASKDIRLMVKRVFITSDLGDDYLPKWASWVKAIVDADDLPLNVSRETLQNTSFLKQVKNAIIKRLIQTFAKIAEEDPDKFQEIQKVYGNVFKLGAVEDLKNRDKLAPLTRFATNHRNNTSLDDYLENKKQGQKQIFYVADIGKSAPSLMKSVFVEKLNARGYEVFLLTDPLDEILFQNLRKWKGVPFQDAAKAGLKFGDENLDPEEEKERLAELKDKFQPLLTWLKGQTNGIVRNVVISDRLVSSPCAIVADERGYTGNIQRMMTASRKGKDENADLMQEFVKLQKVLELNPRSPLIEGLLRRVEQLPSEGEEPDVEAEEELKEVTSILIDGALVRSGFEVADTDEFMMRVDRVLRRSLGVSQTAATDTTVKPAPPVDPELLDESEYEPEPEADPSQFQWPPPMEDDDGKAKVILPPHLKDQVQIDMEEIDDEEYERMTSGQRKHDEL